MEIIALIVLCLNLVTTLYAPTMIGKPRPKFTDFSFGVHVFMSLTTSLLAGRVLGVW